LSIGLLDTWKYQGAHGWMGSTLAVGQASFKRHLKTNVPDPTIHNSDDYQLIRTKRFCNFDLAFPYYLGCPTSHIGRHSSMLNPSLVSTIA
jgi:hypothetical protein